MRLKFTFRVRTAHPASYTVSEEIAKRWADKIGRTLQVASEQLLVQRRI